MPDKQGPVIDVIDVIDVFRLYINYILPPTVFNNIFKRLKRTGWCPSAPMWMLLNTLSKSM